MSSETYIISRNFFQLISRQKDSGIYKKVGDFSWNFGEVCEYLPKAFLNPGEVIDFYTKS
jgi:hypothetical protein